MDITGNDVTATTAFNSAFWVSGDLPFCGLGIEINMLRAGSPTVTVGSTKNVTARARIAKGTAVKGTTIDTTLQIAALDGPELVDVQRSGPIQLGVGKGGKGDTLTMNIDQCNSGSIDFAAKFFGTDTDGNLCEATRRISRSCN